MPAIFAGVIASRIQIAATMEAKSGESAFRIAAVEASMVVFLEQGGRFLKPVLAGDTVTAEMQVEESRPTRDAARGIVRFAVRLTNQRGEIVLSGFHTYLIKRRLA